MKNRLIRITISAALLLSATFLQNTNILISNLLYVASYFVVGYDVVYTAIINLFHGKLFDENFLMSLATVGAFIVHKYPEAVAVMLFYQVGETFQSFAVNKSRKSITSLMDIRPDYANLRTATGYKKVNPYDIKTGDTIIIRPGEKVPLDGIVDDGTSFLDTSALTGESVPREIVKGDEVLSGSINKNGVISLIVTKEFTESTASKILDLVENASNKKSKSENFISRFAAIYTPAVVISAVILAIIPPLFFHGELWSDWIYRALTFLVVSCPCALVISIPLSFFGGIGGASKAGILVKGSNYLEALAKTETIVFDKTGTLTQGVFNVTKIVPADKSISEDDLLKTAAFAECHSTHPISTSLKNAYGKKIDTTLVTQTKEETGNGISTKVKDRHVLIGNNVFMRHNDIEYTKAKEYGTIVHIAVNNHYAGYIVISDIIKPDSKVAIKKLKALKINKTVMLTGDNRYVAEKVGKELGIDRVYAKLLPTDKVNRLEELLKNKSQKSTLAFVGDGINDAPVLARADIGIAMGGVGSDAAIEAADIVIMNDEPSKIATAIGISKKTLCIVYQNIFFALGIKAIFLILSALGVATMWEAVFADVGVSVIAILNALRALNVKE